MKTLSILVVDDEEFMRSTLAHVLGQASHRVKVAGDAATAQRLLDEVSFDVVLTDMLLQEGDGIDVICAARTKQPEAGILVMSGGSGNLRASYCLSLGVAMGAMAPLMKPFSRDELLTALHSVTTPSALAVG